jgi:hypothetical protein
MKQRTGFRLKLGNVVTVLKEMSLQEKGVDALELLNLLRSQSRDSIMVPREESYFGYTVLALLREGKGAVYCKLCDKAYNPKELVAVRIGSGENPLKVTTQYRGG